MDNNYFIIFYLILIIINFKCNFSYIVLPFKFQTFSNTENITEIVYNLINNKLIIPLTIGNPQKNIEFYSSMNEYIYYLEEDSCLNNISSSYIYENSKSFSKIRKVEDCPIFPYLCSICSDSIYIYEDIYLKNKIEISSFIFYLLNKNNDNNKKDKPLCGKIGFKLENSPYRMYEYENFIGILKRKSIINSYSWYVHYFEKPMKYKENKFYDGAIIIDIFNKKFYDDFPYFKANNDYKYAKAKDLERILSWTFSLSNIYFSLNDSKIEINNRNAGLAFEIDFILCPQEYFEFIKSNFFDYFIKNNICFLVEGKYSYIYCNTNLFKKYVNKFPTLYFQSYELNKTFILDKDDLFKEYNNNLLFMIIYEKYSNKLWALGKIFMKKYNFYFDNDKKVIGCFEKTIPQKENKKNINIFKWILFIILGIIIGFIIGTKIKDKNRKLRANELEDKFDYLTNKIID